MTQLKKRILSADEKRRVVLLLHEMKSRGLEIPKLKTKILDAKEWNTDENGYFVRDDGKHYKPKGDAGNFIASNSIFSSYFGSRGSGKTAAGAQKALKKIMSGEDGAVLNPSFENFKYSTWPELKQWIPWNMVVPKQRYRQTESWEAARPFTLVFVNGAKMYCKGLHNPEGARGANVNWLWYDEARADITGLAWKIAIACVRVGANTQRWVTTTPASLDHWLYTFFIRQEIPREVIDRLTEVGELQRRTLIETFYGTIEQNKENLDPIFYASLVSAYPTGYLRAREIEGQFANEGGGLGSRSWFDNTTLTDEPDWIARKIRYWDLAASEKKGGTDPDETVGSLVGVDKEKTRFCILQQHGGFWAWDRIKENIQAVARVDGTGVAIYVEQEPGSGGINQVAEIANVLKKDGFTVRPHNPKKDGDRVMAANVWFAEAAKGMWYLVKGAWTERFFGQMDAFPEGSHDDRITSVSGARHELAPIRKWRKLRFMSLSDGIKKDAPKVGIGKI
uniref:Putative terminase n=1 Tax=viral metagenome TaxID=1070528 RepID=A0A6H1ZAG7_9ZZZZ